MNKLLEHFGIDESLTKSIRQSKEFNKIRDNIPHKKGYNMMADLLFLPTTKEGYRYCLVVVDLATNEFDIEPIKNKEPETILRAFESMFKRGYIVKPYASIRTDSGSEFKGKFANWLYNNSILHRVGKSGRHKQSANVESLNKQLGRLFNGYMNAQMKKRGKAYPNWTDIIEDVRVKLNKLRKLPEDDPVKYNYPIPDMKQLLHSKYKVGDIVYIKLENPENALGEKMSGSFRVGDYRFDSTPRKITDVFLYSGKPAVRYRVTGIKNVSYADYELMPAKEDVDKYKVERIVAKKKIKGKLHFLIKWKGYPKSQNTWEPKTTLMLDVPELVEEYEQSIKR